ncbi:hypothetical protein CIHG_03905 [Coccidioides immitis H538.4]|uniref:Uncharacterized protein n=1 Tax=Coccidioides immitis H538.4 TaxID=396776 RepID=A0A0J8RMT0_COCIT|nr:hypothetical protein CIHG_03905 [Coccidioides immitis H538.4]
MEVVKGSRDALTLRIRGTSVAKTAKRVGLDIKKQAVISV